VNLDSQAQTVTVTLMNVSQTNAATKQSALTTLMDFNANVLQDIMVACVTKK
jgi:hypothetical protein